MKRFKNDNLIYSRLSFLRLYDSEPNLQIIIAAEMTIIAIKEPSKPRRRISKKIKVNFTL